MPVPYGEGDFEREIERLQSIFNSKCEVRKTIRFLFWPNYHFLLINIYLLQIFYFCKEWLHSYDSLSKNTYITSNIIIEKVKLIIFLVTNLYLCMITLNQSLLSFIYRQKKRWAVREKTPNPSIF